jgi:hypothetical protein
MVITNTDITIYIEGAGVAYTVRYEVRSTLTDVISASIAVRLRKSFNLNSTIPDAYTEPAILRKADLMKSIFRSEYGLSATIVDLITR